MLQTFLINLVFFLLLNPAGANVSGRWSGVIEIDDSNSGLIKTPVQLELAQQEAAVTGHIGRRLDQERVPIRNGRIDGNQISFDAASLETSSAMRFTLLLDGDSMQGEMRGKVEEGAIVGKVSFQRMKE